MNDLLTLLRLRLRLLSRPGSASSTSSVGRRRNTLLVRVLVLAVLAVIAAATLAGLLGRVVSGPLGRLLFAPLLAWVSSATSLLVFLFAVPVVLGAFTYNSDLKLLLLTPLSPRLLLAEKFLALFGSLVLPLLVLGLLILVGVGRALGLGLGYDLMAVVTLLVLPIAPLAVAMLLTVAVLRWVPPARARSITAVLGALFGIAFYLGSQLLGRGGGRGAAALQSFIQDTPTAWWGSLPTTWPGRALAEAGQGHVGAALAYLGASLLLAALLAGIAIVLSAHLLATGWATYQEVGRRSHPTAAPPVPAPTVPALPLADVHVAPGAVASGGGAGVADIGAFNPIGVALARPAGAAHERRGPAWWPLLGKEWRSLRRDTQVWARLLYPLFVLGFGLYQAIARGTGGSGGAASVAGGATSLVSVGWLAGTLTMLVYFLLVVLALPIVNREGRSLYLLALAPLSARDVLLSKWSFCALPVLLLVEIALVAGAIIMRVPPGQTLLAVCAFAALVVAMSGGLLLISLIWPRLDWDNPRRQVSGTASLVGSFSGLLLGAGTCVLLILTLVWASSRPMDALATGAGIFVLTGLVAAVAFTVAPRRLERLLRP